MILFLILITAAVILIITRVYLWAKDRELLRTVTDTRRGTRSERRLVLRLLKKGIPAVTIYHDLYVEKAPDQYSQIDAVVLTKVGIIVIEVKDYSGWIYGRGYHDYWVQSLAYGKEKHRFYNPVLQNDGHIEALRRRLRGIADVPFYSVILFYGNCRLRDIRDLPDDTYVGYSKEIMSIIRRITRHNPPARYADKRGLIALLQQSAANGENRKIIHRHIKNIHHTTPRYD